MPSIQGLDHVIILVRDLGRSEAAIARLGFRITPRGVHSPEMGTANATAVFRGRTYLELMTVLNETPLNRSLAAIQREREGLTGIAMKTNDAHAAAAEFEAAGVGAGEAADFSRPVELPGGMRTAAFTIARLDPAKTPGAWMFACQHHTPDVVWRVDHLDQPNGASGLAEVVGTASDLDALGRAYTPIFGRERVRRTDERLVIDAGSAKIIFLAPIAFAARFGQTPLDPDPHLAALSFRTASLDRANEVLRSNKVGFASSQSDNKILVPAVSATGVSFEFVERGPA